jgi:hypothetical protein
MKTRLTLSVRKLVATGLLLGLALSLNAGPALADDGKPKVRSAGLEFRIVANSRDDRLAFAAAKKGLAAARTNARDRKRMEQLAQRGQPPDLPKPAKGRVFATPLGKYSYAWVELAPAELRHLDLTPAAAKDPKRNALWKKVAKARDKGEAVETAEESLLFSRPCVNRKLTKDQRRKKQFDYFVLLRDPAPGKAITEKYLVNVRAARDTGKNPAVNLALNKKGGKLMHDLTSLNKPAGKKAEFRRHLGVILKGRVVGAYAIRDPIGGRGQISGHFSKDEVATMVKALRGSIPPARE